jgi:hypothetical protein
MTSISSQEPKSTKEFESRVYEAPEKLTLKAVEKILKEKGYETKVDESRSGVLESDFTVDGHVRSKAKAIISPISKRKTEVRLKLHVEKRTFFGKEWKPIGINASVYEEVLDAIQMQIYREYFEKIRDGSN